MVAGVVVEEGDIMVIVECPVCELSLSIEPEGGDDMTICDDCGVWLSIFEEGERIILEEMED